MPKRDSGRGVCAGAGSGREENGVCRSTKDLQRLQKMGLLDALLEDKTSGGKIVWATDAYSALGPGYGRRDEITAGLLLRDSFRLMSRAEKARSERSERTKSRAEVFTPFWVVKKMLDHMDAEWFGREGIFGAERLSFPPGVTWREYVDSRRMEIACGEAPYLTARYDVSSGAQIPPAERAGIADRKLRAVSENASSAEEWLFWALRAFKASYGYEFQGDNLLLARLNLLLTFEDAARAKLGREPSEKEYRALLNIIAWNVWQMDGLTDMLPYRAEERPSLFAIPKRNGGEAESSGPACRVSLWRAKGRTVVEYRSLKGGRKMDFDFIIGNPPYQDETVGEQKTFAPPIYDKFLSEAYKIAGRVELIHPARFLFNAGSTPKAWNEKMLADPHLKVLWHEPNSANVFPDTDIKGGVAVTYRDAGREFGAIGVFTCFPELNSILYKVTSGHFNSFSTIVVSSYVYHFTEELHKDFSDAEQRMSKGHAYDLKTNVFQRLNHVFYDEKPNDGHDYIQIYGLEGSSRVYKYIRADYVNQVKNLYAWKVFVPKSNGSGALGEVLSTPVIGQPVIGHTESFISIGTFATQREAENCLAYVKSKFARTMLGVLKITQDNPPEKWKYVPLQDFTAASDIDWTRPVPEIDRQLYAKYGLDEAETAFIESRVKEMA